MPASEEFPQFDKSNERRNTQSGESHESIARNYRPPPTGFEPPRLLPSHNQEFRQQEETRLKNLGLPHQNPTQATKYTQKSSSSTVQSTKKPARTFDPDKNFKAFENYFPSKKATHKDYDFSQYFTRKNAAVTTPSPRRQFSANNNVANKNQLPSGPNAANRPFVNNHFNQQKSPATAATTRKPVTTTPRTTARTSPTVHSTNAKKTPLVTRSPSYYQPQARSNHQQQPQVPINQNQITAPPSSQPKTTQQQQQLTQGHKKIISAPANDLLPPHEIIKHYDDATTRGPPIYYEWRVPDEGLLPPKFDNETDTNSLKRSITEEGTHDSDFQSSETRRYSGGGRNSIKIQYKDLQKLFAIPDVEFNLETNGREGYDNAEAVNSFQVKIPYRKDVTGKSSLEDRYYYLEHGHCNPECHPYFFKPGRCEPCIKLKKK